MLVSPYISVYTIELVLCDVGYTHTAGIGLLAIYEGLATASIFAGKDNTLANCPVKMSNHCSGLPLRYNKGYCREVHTECHGLSSTDIFHTHIVLN